jgi:hypothetical protein
MSYVLCCRNKIGALEACEYVPNMFVLYMKDPYVTLWAVRAIADMAANNPNNQARLGNHGACEALVAAIKMITTEDASYASALTPTAGLTATGSLFGMFNASPAFGGAFSSSAAAIESSRNNSSSQVLADSPPHSVQSTASGKMKSPFTPAECEDLSKWLLWAIGNMIQVGRGGAMMVDEGSRRGVFNMSESVSNSSRINAVGGAEAVTALLLKYEGNAVIAQWGSRAINSMCRSRTLTVKLLDNRAVDLLNVLLSNHAGSSNAEYWIKTAKDTLQQYRENARPTSTPQHQQQY